MNRHLIPQSRQQQLSKALDQMIDALRLLDEAGAPGEIGSHLDLAIARMRDALGLKDDTPISLDALLQG